jgi:hypothetical protein
MRGAPLLHKKYVSLVLYKKVEDNIRMVRSEIGCRLDLAGSE